MSKVTDAIKEQHGEDFFRNIGTKGGNGLVKSRGKEYMRLIGQQGGYTKERNKRLKNANLHTV